MNPKEVMETLAREWESAGIERGDTVLLHSNIRRHLLQIWRKRPDFDPCHIILESFLHLLSDDGTLLCPLFNFDFPESKFFDIRNTPSQMGALTEAARKHPGAVRTGHPIYSFAAIGKKSDRFSDVDNLSGYGEDSPFAILRELDGKIAALDLEDQNSMTFYHHVEEMEKVPYRYFKNFSGNYIDASGVETTKTCKLFVRKIDQGVLTHVNPAGELMWKEGLYRGCRPGEDCGLRTINANDMYDFVSQLIRENKALGTLYRIGQPS